MIDIKLIREKADEVKAKIKKRNMDLDSVVDSIIEIDAKRREVIGKVEAMKAEQKFLKSRRLAAMLPKLWLR